MKTHRVQNKSAELRYKASPDWVLFLQPALGVQLREGGGLPPGRVMSCWSIKTSGRGKHMSVTPDYTRRAEMEPLGDSLGLIIAHLEQPGTHQPIL